MYSPSNILGIDVGSVSAMVCRICDVRGGVNYSLFGRWGLGDRRYALRELVYREMIEDSVDYQYMTGPAMIGLMSKADALMEKKGLYEVETLDLSDETDRDEFGNLIVPTELPSPPGAGPQDRAQQEDRIGGEPLQPVGRRSH